MTNSGATVVKNFVRWRRWIGVLPPVRSLKRLLAPVLVALIPSAPAAAAEGAATAAERAPGFMKVRLARHPTRRAVRRA